jgi:hypothetical protein
MLKQLSPETALKLAQELRIPISQLVHTPRHIVLAKLAELAKKQADETNAVQTDSVDKKESE